MLMVLNEAGLCYFATLTKKGCVWLILTFENELNGQGKMKVSLMRHTEYHFPIEK